MRKVDNLYKFIGVAALLIIWEAAALLFNKAILPTPVQVCAAFFQNISSLCFHALVSLYRVGIAIVISLIPAVLIGILTGYFKTADKIISPLVYILYPIPKIALLPVVMLLFGLGDTSKITVMVLILTFQLIITIRDGVKTIPNEYFIPYYAAGCTFRVIASKIIIPAVMPNIFTGLRNSFAAAISVLFFSESYGTKLGLGYYVMDAWLRISYKQMYAGIVALALMGVLMYMLLDSLERLFD